MVHVREVFVNINLAILYLTCGLLRFTDTLSGAEEPPAITATATSLIHPVLIRNQYGQLSRVIVEASNPKDVRMNAASFSLDGTDDLADLESLTLFATSDIVEFSSAMPFGEPLKPARKVTFRGKQALSVGQNVFWLSCRLKAIGGRTNNGLRPHHICHGEPILEIVG